MPWRVARSLDVLLKQLNTAFPTRSRVSDGSIGDPAHQARDSDHNPRSIYGAGPAIVTARDYTHDPRAGVNIVVLADQLVASRDPRIKYVIANRRIWTPGAGWRRYSGANPHSSHLHLSVVASPLCDDTRPWALPMLGAPPTDGWVEMEDLMAAGVPVLRKGDGFKGPRGGVHWYVLSLQVLLNARGLSKPTDEDGLFGPGTEALVRELQQRAGLAVDGIVGPATWAAALGNDAPDWAA